MANKKIIRCLKITALCFLLAFNPLLLPAPPVHAFENTDQVNKCIRLSDSKSRSSCLDKLAKSIGSDLHLEEKEIMSDAQAYSSAIVMVFLAILGSHFGKGTTLWGIDKDLRHQAKVTGNPVPVCTYQLLFNIAAVSTLVGELVSFSYVDEKLKQLYKKINRQKDNNVKDLSDYFHLLSNKQSTIVSTLQMKSFIFTGLAALYTASGALAFASVLSPSQSCEHETFKRYDEGFYSASATFPKNIKLEFGKNLSVSDSIFKYLEWRGQVNNQRHSPSMDEYYAIKESMEVSNQPKEAAAALQFILKMTTALSSAHAATTAPKATQMSLQSSIRPYMGMVGKLLLSGALSVLALNQLGIFNMLKKQVSSMLGKSIHSPDGIGLLSLINGSISLYMSIYNIKKYFEERDNKKVIDNLTARMAKTDDPSAVSSQTTAGRKATSSATSSTKKAGCLDGNGNYDSTCSCQDCLKTPSLSKKDFQVTTMTGAYSDLGLDSASEFTKSLTNGKVSTSSLGLDSSLGKMAFNNRNTAKELLNKVNKDRKDRKLPPLYENTALKSQVANSIIKMPQLLTSAKDTILGKGSNVAGNFGLSRAELDKLIPGEQKVKKGTDLRSLLSGSSSSGDDDIPSRPRKTKDWSSLFKWGGKKAPPRRKRESNVIQFKRKYFEKAIEKKKDKNIFTIINRRYSITGPKRLI